MASANASAILRDAAVCLSSNPRLVIVFPPASKSVVTPSNFSLVIRTPGTEFLADKVFDLFCYMILGKRHRNEHDQ
jgi:hypothetical protein